MRAHAKPLLGLAYLGVVVLLVISSILVFRKDMPWQSTATLTLKTKAPGLELNPLSDVKLQGLVVGRVKSIQSNGQTATIELAIDKNKLHLIPADVDAAIIPKTLFGEKFVDLKSPGGTATTQASAKHIADGGVIAQSTTSVELGAIFAKLTPILETLKPDELSVTLSTLADALDGRGETVARDLNQVQSVLSKIDPHLNTLTHDIDQLGRTSSLYADVAPELLKVLGSTSGISNELLVPKEKSFAAVLKQVTVTSGDAIKVLKTNHDNLVELTTRSRPVLALLDTYSPELPCVLKALHTVDILGNQSVGARGPFVNLIADLVAATKPYTYPDDLPGSASSDANNNNLPLAVPNWKPHCPEFAPRVLALKDAEPYSLPLMPGTAINPTLQPRSGGAR